MPWLLISAALPVFPLGTSSVIFLVTMQVSINKDQTATQTGRRSMFMNITVAITTLAFGSWLGNVRFPFNYQSMFVVAFILSGINLLMVMRIKPIEVEKNPAAGSGSRAALAIGWISALTHISFFTIVPIVLLHLIDNLGADEGFVSIFAFSGTVGGTLMSAYAYRIVRRIGSQHARGMGMLGSGVAGAIITLTPTMYLVPVGGIIGGLFWTLAAISQFTYFTENTSPENLTRFTTLYHQIIMLAVFTGPMIGSQLASTPLSLTTVLIFGSSLRVVTVLVISADNLIAPAVRQRSAEPVIPLKDNAPDDGGMIAVLSGITGLVR